MSKSTQVITDLTTVTTTAFSAASYAKAINPTGPIQDLDGNAKLALQLAKDLKNLLLQMKNGTDAGDGNLTTYQQVIDVLV